MRIVVDGYNKVNGERARWLGDGWVVVIKRFSNKMFIIFRL